MHLAVLRLVAPASPAAMPANWQGGDEPGVRPSPLMLLGLRPQRKGGDPSCVPPAEPTGTGDTKKGQDAGKQKINK